MWHGKSFLPIQSLTSLLHILTPLANKGKFFFPEGIYVPFSSEFNAGNPLITKGLPTMGPCHHPGTFQALSFPARSVYKPWLHVACSSLNVKSGKETNVFAVDALYVSSDSSSSIVSTKSCPPLPRWDFASTLKAEFLEAEQIVRAG